MINPLPFIALASVLVASAASAQPANKYNDSYQDQRYLHNNTQNTQGNPQKTTWDSVVVSSPTPHDRPLTQEEMRNAKPMGKYIDASPSSMRPLPRGGNQSPPHVSAYATSSPPQQGVISGAAQGYSAGRQ